MLERLDTDVRERERSVRRVCFGRPANELGQVPRSGVALRDRGAGSGGECAHVLSSDLGFGGGNDPDAAAGEDVESEVAAAFGPFVGLFGQDFTDEPHDGVWVGEDADGWGQLPLAGDGAAA